MAKRNTGIEKMKKTRGRKTKKRLAAKHAMLAERSAKKRS
tara:strand:- start:13480 stop:13599 length:120 start_codon:yes stop_codon:yes gene_type:complete